MKNKNAYGMSIRLPKELVQILQKVKKEQQLPSIATAIKFWVEEQVNQKTESRLSTVEATVKKHTKQINAMLDGIVKDLENLPGIIVEKLKATDEFIT